MIILLCGRSSNTIQPLCGSLLDHHILQNSCCTLGSSNILLLLFLLLFLLLCDRWQTSTSPGSWSRLCWWGHCVGLRLTSPLKFSPMRPPPDTASLWTPGASESSSLSGTHTHRYIHSRLHVFDLTNTSPSLCPSVSLGGYPPFHEDFGRSVTDQIIQGEFVMKPPRWKHVSAQGTTALLQYCNSKLVKNENSTTTVIRLYYCSTV